MRKATSVTAAECHGAVIPSDLYVPVNSAVVHSQNTRLELFVSTCHVKELACFYEPQFGRVSLNISISDSVLETRRLQAEVLNYSSFLLLQNVNFDGLTFLTALVLSDQILTEILIGLL